MINGLRCPSDSEKCSTLSNTQKNRLGWGGTKFDNSTSRKLMIRAWGAVSGVRAWRPRQAAAQKIMTLNFMFINKGGTEEVVVVGGFAPPPGGATFRPTTVSLSDIYRHGTGAYNHSSSWIAATTLMALRPSSMLD